MTSKRLHPIIAIVWVLWSGGAAAETTGGNVVWSGGEGAGNPYWNVPGNWSGGQAPANPTPGQIRYDNIGQDVSGKLDADYTVGGVRTVNNHSTHTLDLNAHTLTVIGEWYQERVTTLVAGNGVIQIGNASTSGSIELRGQHDTQRLQFRNGGRLYTRNVTSVTLGNGTSNHRELDLRGSGGLAGGLTNGTFAVNSLSANRGSLLIDAGSGIEELHFRTGLSLRNYTTKVCIGPGDADQILPAGVNLRFGVDGANRANVTLGAAGPVNSGKLTARSDGHINAWVGNLNVGAAAGTSSGSPIGILNLAAMTNAVMDVLNFRIGTDRDVPLGADAPQGTVRLPAGSAVTVSDLRVGGAMGGYGQLVFANAHFVVTNSLTLCATGVITNHVHTAASGLDITGALIDEGGRIHVNFMAPPTADIHWAIRIDGNAASILQGMVGQGRLTWTYDEEDTGFADKSFRAFYDENTSKTYFAITDYVTPEPVALARDLTFEALPDVPVLVHVSEVDAGSFDPEDRDFVWDLSYNDQTNVESLSLTGIGTYPGVTLRIMLVDEQGDPLLDEEDNPITDSDAATITIEAVADAVTSNVRWSGTAPTELMDRREWMWGLNWVGAAPPAIETTGNIEFDARGQSVTGRLDADRIIGGVKAVEAATHTIDLNSHALTVAGTWDQRDASATLYVTNGTLRIGTIATPGSIRVSRAHASPRLFLRNGAILHTVNADVLQAGGDAGGSARYVDIQDAVVSGGTLDFNTISVGRHGQILLGDQTLNTIRVRTTLSLRWDAGGIIGKPGDQILPAGINLELGQDAGNRAAVNVGSGSTIGRMVARYDGILSAWIGGLAVGTGSSGNGTLGLTAMSSGMVDALTVNVGTDTATGTLGLPPGQAVIGSLAVGGASGAGTLILNQTRTSVTDGVTLNASANVTINVGAGPGGGLTIDGGFALAFGAVIHIDFMAEPEHGGLHYGLKIEGDHADDLTAMRSAGNLTWDHSALGREAVIFSRADGYTYVGVPPLRGSLFRLR